MRVRLVAAAALAALTGCAAGPRPAAPTPGLTLDRVVLLMRHGVRPPTKAVPMPPGTTADAWPTWSVAPGELTTHGAVALKLLGAADRTDLAPASLRTPGCPAPAAVRVHADSDQRTIASADAWLAGFAPGCAIPNVHQPQDTPDPLFAPIELKVVPFDPARADRAARARLGPGGIAAIEAGQRPVLDRLDAIYCGAQRPPACGVSATPTTLAPPVADDKPGIEGALDRGSTAGQILLLEYADGKPMAEVGWGRATPADIAAASALHAIEYDIVARPPYVAAVTAAPLLRRMLAALEAPNGAPALDLIVGHDGNVAASAGLFDLHWQVPGLAADDPAPGGAIAFERLRDARGGLYVRAVYRAQTLDQMRTLTPLGAAAPPYRAVLAIRGCAPAPGVGACPLAAFAALVRQRLAILDRPAGDDDARLP